MKCKQQRNDGGQYPNAHFAEVKQYIEAVRHNDVSALPLHPDAVCELPTNTYRGAASCRKGLGDFARIMKGIEIIRLSVRGYCDPRPMLAGTKIPT